MNMIPLVVIVGPTASGKTSLSVELSKILDAEIVSADSMQIYKKMDIATAKPTMEERCSIVHHLMDFLDFTESFSVAQYCELAHPAISDIYARGKLPIVVGGTGLYVDSLVNNITFVNTPEDKKLRESLYSLYDEHGVDYLLDMLSKFDSESAKRLSEQKNVKRIIRAIEVYKTTGITQTQINIDSKRNISPYKAVKIGLKPYDRQFLYDRIEKRVDQMISDGLLDEAKEFLSQHSSNTASMAIGYKELAPYFSGDAELSSCVQNLKKQSRRYAKRQLTWFSKDESINWLYIDKLTHNELVGSALDIIKRNLKYE